MKRLIPLLILMASDPAFALEPKEIFLLVNKNLPASKEVAEHYCKKRNVPLANMILLDVRDSEDISRKDYNAKIVEPLREALQSRKEQAKVLLSVYGVPLRVGGQAPNDEERAQLKEVEPKIKELQAKLKEIRGEILAYELAERIVSSSDGKKKLGELKEPLPKLEAELATLESRRGRLTYPESHACVDSELMLLWWDKYELRRWQMNLLYFQVPEKAREGKPQTLLTCRLDSPTAAIAMGLVDRAIEVEEKGLQGKVYVDARGIRYDAKNDPGFGYGGYDESMREMAALLEKEGKMTVVLDDKPELFQPNQCTECALYCGWYSHANFIDCCRFVPGAIAWHLASSEAVSLRRPDVRFWCKNLLEKGAAATLGPVGEPYTIGFPKPAEFFAFLATGKYTLVESYGRTVMLCSWMGVLIGDPLYKPFAKNPKLKEEQVGPSPKGGKFILNLK